MEDLREQDTAFGPDLVPVLDAIDADDVADLVRHARRAGLRIAARTSPDRAPASVEAIVLRTARLDEVSVDPWSRTARVGAGVPMAALTAAAAAHGLAATPSASPAESVAGYALKGGIGWFARKYGLASDHVTAFEVVDADGNRVRASAHENTDLFWALSGGGGDCAIVTALEMRLHDEPEVSVGTITWPAAAAYEVFAAIREVAATVSDELTLWTTLARCPGAHEVIQVGAASIGPEHEAWELLEAFEAVGGELADLRGTATATEIGTIAGDPMDPRIPSLARVELLARLDDTAVDALLAAPLGPLSAVRIQQLGGRLARPSAKGPHGAITEDFALSMTGPAGTPDAAAVVAAWQAGLVAALGDTVTGRKPLALLGLSASPVRAFDREQLARLREIEAAWDPEDVFVGEQR